MTIELPIVVRLDGTNAEEGREILADAAPPNLYVEPTMLEAARSARWSWRHDATSGRARGARYRDERRRIARAPTSSCSSSGASPAAGVTALDVATGGGHVARRLREEGCTVVTVDPAPGHAARCRLPARKTSRSQTAASTSSPARIAPHHFDDIAHGGRRDGARRARPRRDRGHALRRRAVEEAEQLRDPTHVRSYTEEEWQRAA